MKKIIYIIASLLLIPLVVSAETIPVGSTKKTCSGITHIEYRYTIGGKSVTCMDPDLTSPYYVNQSTSYSYGCDKCNFTDGLIAMSNYAKKNNVSECDQSEAFRIYPFKADDLYVVGSPGVISNTSFSIIGKLKNYSPGNDAIGKMLKVGLCAHDGGEGNYCNDINIDEYIPSDSSGAGKVTVTDVKQDATTDGKKYTINATIDIEKENSDAKVTFKGCSGNGIKCAAAGDTDLTNSSSIDIIVTGTISKKNTVDVTLKFDGIVGNGDIISEIKIYTCVGNANVCSPVNNYQPNPSYQRFVELVNGKSTEKSSEVKVTLNVPSICDDPDMSDLDKLKNGCANCDSIDPTTLEEDSKEEDAYIKQCGPIVHLENDCGADSCSSDGELNKDSYRAFNHSYIRGRSMKYIMLELEDQGEEPINFGSYGKYLDNVVNNEYCASFVTEKIDLFTPGTAASISGQFFIFDSYNESGDINNPNSYFRQPYVVDRTKKTFFFHARRWKKDYISAATTEQNMYDAWQGFVTALPGTQKALADAKKAYDDAKSTYNPCHLTKDVCTAHDDKGFCTSLKSEIDQARCDSIINAAKNAYNEAKTTHEETAKNAAEAEKAYGGWVGKRIGLQKIYNDCHNALEGFSAEYDGNDIPEITFSYEQNSEKYGKKENTINMIEAKDSVKYWPNTSSGFDSGDYLGKNMYFPLNSETAESARDSGETSLPAHVPGVLSRDGQYVINPGDEDTTPTFEEYHLGSTSHIDGCSGDAKSCRQFNYNNLSYNSQQGIASDGASDPYGDNVKMSDSKEQVSKFTFYRPPNSTFALMNTGEYQTIDYESNAAMKNISGLEVGYVYNIELTSYKGQYTTKFAFSNLGFASGGIKTMFTEAINKYLTNHPEIDGLSSTCNYCNMEMAFRRNCDECDDTQTYDFEAQFYYRAIALSDVTPTEREDNETNWSDAKGKVAAALIEQGSGLASLNNNDNNNYIALTSDTDATTKADDSKLSTYLADSSSSGKYDIYDDESRDYLEYEVTLTTKDLQTIKKNTSKSYFKYSTMNMCGTETTQKGKDSDIEYCFDCNSDMKECKSTFVESYFSDTSGRDNKWKYYVNGKFCTGDISSCIKGLDYVMVDSSGNTVENKDGVYPDPLYPQKFLEKYKNWP
mgnify:CR=1 FL=1